MPLVAEETCFALKGGTAINLFVRDLPRLSVDIDLTYLPVASWDESLRDVDAALRRIAGRIEASLAAARVQPGTVRGEDAVNKLFVRDGRVQVKIEVTPVLRGCVYEPEERAVSQTVERLLGFAAIRVVSFADLFAGKLVAALDRQHPRDLFDVRELLAREGIDDRLRTAFIVYLISHNRPLAELLAPVRRDMEEEFERGLAGMTEVPVTLDALVDTREALIADVVGRMPDAHKRFLLSFEEGAPDWSLLDVPDAARLPAVQWRMANLARLDGPRRSELATGLAAALAESAKRSLGQGLGRYRRMTRMDYPQLQDIVDAPWERLDVEYKTWLNLDDKEAQAKLAKHLCALANHGGGFVVFGIADDMTPAGQQPPEAGPYDQDRLSGIVRRYLTPAFQVAVYRVTASGTGITHPVVWVPSHEAVPVCSRRSGPKDDGEAVGIEQITHYTREAGPESVPVTTPEHWRPIIRRCVLYERQALLAGLEPLLRSPGGPVSEPGEALRRWHEASHRKFLEAVDGNQDDDLLKRAHYQFSYRINAADGEQLRMVGFVDELRRIGNEVMQFVDTGWSMFQILNVVDLMPRSTFDSNLGEDEFLECDLVSVPGRQLSLPDFWRVSPAGMATIVRAYREDRLHDWSDAAGSGPGTWIWPRGMAREIAEMIRHARALAERFEAPETVSFRAEWFGLQGRTLGDPENPIVQFRSGTARDEWRMVTKTVPVAGLAKGWPELTADILSLVLRNFDANDSVSAQDIRDWSDKFRR